MKIREEIPESFEKKSVIGKVIRQLIYDTCKLIKYDFINDKRLINFSDRTFNKINFRGL